MVSEDERKTVIEIKLSYNSEFNNQRGNKYCLNSGTIITCKRNSMDEHDLAISFQEKEGLNEILYDIIYLGNSFSNFKEKSTAKIL